MISMREEMLHLAPILTGSFRVSPPRSKLFIDIFQQSRVKKPGLYHLMKHKVNLKIGDEPTDEHFLFRFIQALRVAVASNEED